LRFVLVLVLDRGALCVLPGGGAIEYDLISDSRAARGEPPIEDEDDDEYEDD
jgi:hypothetical protein